MFKKMRRSDKQLSNETTLELLKNGQEGVLGTLSENGYPYTVVLNYVYYNDKVYFHCAKSGLKLDNIRYHDKVSFTVYGDVEVVGQDLNTLYKSLTLFGKARVMDARHDVLKALINKYANIPNEKADLMIKNEINDTAIIEMEILHITGKKGK